MITPTESYLINLNLEMSEKLTRYSDKLNITKKKLIEKSLQSQFNYLENVYFPALENIDDDLTPFMENIDE